MASLRISYQIENLPLDFVEMGDAKLWEGVNHLTWMKYRTSLISRFGYSVNNCFLWLFLPAAEHAGLQVALESGIWERSQVQLWLPKEWKTLFPLVSYLYGDNTILTENTHGITEEGLIHVGFKLKVRMKIMIRAWQVEHKDLETATTFFMVPKAKENRLMQERSCLFTYPADPKSTYASHHSDKLRCWSQMM